MASPPLRSEGRRLSEHTVRAQVVAAVVVFSAFLSARLVAVQPGLVPHLTPDLLLTVLLITLGAALTINASRRRPSVPFAIHPPNLYLVLLTPISRRTALQGTLTKVTIAFGAAGAFPMVVLGWNAETIPGWHSLLTPLLWAMGGCLAGASLPLLEVLSTRDLVDRGHRYRTAMAVSAAVVLAAVGYLYTSGVTTAPASVAALVCVGLLVTVYLSLYSARVLDTIDLATLRTAADAKVSRVGALLSLDPHWLLSTLRGRPRVRGTRTSPVGSYLGYGWASLRRLSGARIGEAVALSLLAAVAMAGSTGPPRVIAAVVIYAVMAIEMSQPIATWAQVAIGRTLLPFPSARQMVELHVPTLLGLFALLLPSTASACLALDRPCWASGVQTVTLAMALTLFGGTLAIAGKAGPPIVLGTPGSTLRPSEATLWRIYLPLLLVIVYPSSFVGGEPSGTLGSVGGLLLDVLLFALLATGLHRRLAKWWCRP